MKLKYWGTAYEKGLTLTADLYDSEGTLMVQGVAMTETALNSAIYKTAEIVTPLSAGIYVARIIDATGNFIGHEELIYDGLRVITLLELKFLSDKELMQLRDALGLDGNKLLAKGGQLQMKSEAPYNTVINTSKLE